MNDLFLPTQVDVKYNDDKDKTYTVKYTPKLEGPHKVKVNFAGKQIPKSPFDIKVEGFAGDPSKVKTSGPGLEPTGVVAGAPTYFDVDTIGRLSCDNLSFNHFIDFEFEYFALILEAGLGNIEVIVLDPKESKTAVPCKVTKTADGHFHCEYTPNEAGMHSINVFFVSKLIPKSPFGVKVSPGIVTVN